MLILLRNLSFFKKCLIFLLTNYQQRNILMYKSTVKCEEQEMTSSYHRSQKAVSWWEMAARND